MSLGKVLAHVYELRKELNLFLTNERCDDAKLLASGEWCARLTYLADILQGRKENLLTSADKINGFCSKHLLSANLDMFPLTQK